MASKRIIFQAEQLFIAPASGFTAFTSGQVVHGAQSVGMNGSVPITSLYELGQASPYEQTEEAVEFTASVDKFLDGYPLVYHLATRDATYPTLLGRSDSKCHIGLALFPETNQYASGAADFGCWMSGFYVSNYGINIPIQGGCTESTSFVGNVRKWYSSAYRASEAATLNVLSGYWTGSHGFSVPDSPLSSSGVMKREDVLFDYTTSYATDSNSLPVYASGTTLPRAIPGIDTSGRNTFTGTSILCDYATKLQSIKFSVGLNRNSDYELGCKLPYNRSLNPTIDVNTDIEIIAISGDFVEALENGLYSNGDNTRNESIRVALRDGTRISTGTKNRLTNFSVGGGGTDGSNMTVTYTFNTKNTFDILHPADPKFGSVQSGYSISSGVASGHYFN